MRKSSTTNPKMFLRFNGSGQEKNQFFLTASKNNEYSYLFIDKNGNVGRLNTGLNSLIRGYNRKDMNTKITHKIH